jgi:hypothetical protein
VIVSPLIVFLGLFLIAAVGFIIARLVTKPAPHASAESTCGNCGYIVRGISGTICPECGRDLLEVGIIPPGGHKGFSRPTRVLLWTAISIAPAMLLGSIAGQYLSPWQAMSMRNRVVFIQSATFNETVEIHQEGTRTVIGRPGTMAPVPPRLMTLTLGGKRGSGVMTVDLMIPPGSLPGSRGPRNAQFTDAAGKTAAAPLSADFIASWFTANGVTDPAVAERSADVLSAIDEMDNGGGAKFSNFGFNPQRRMNEVTAHPAPPPFTFPRTTQWTNVVPIACAFLLWLLGLPLALRRPRSQRPPPRTIAGDAIKA